MPDVTIQFDKPRRLTYRWTDARTICQRCGNISLVEFLTRIGQTNPDVLHTALFIGLSNEDPKLTGKKLDDLVQAYIDNGGQLSALVNDVLEALTDDGILFKEKKTENPTQS